MKNKKTIFAFTGILLILSLVLVMAIDFNPNGDIDLKNIWKIKNVTSITTQNLTVSGSIFGFDNKTTLSCNNITGSAGSLCINQTLAANNYANNIFITKTNESNLNVNYSKYSNSSSNWGNLNSINLTQMENSGGILHILESWLNTLFYGKSSVYNKTEIDDKNNLIDTTINSFYSSARTNCYQESANVSTSCGGLATGSYSQGGNSTDGDWDTFEVLSNDLYINYTIPTSAILINSNISIKINGTTESFMIPSTCGNINGKLLLRYRLVVGYYLFCSKDGEFGNSNMTNINYFGDSIDNANFYEEGMNWNVINSSSVVITADSFSGNGASLTNLSWSNLDSFPVACPTGSFISQLGSSTTCTSPSVTNYDNLTATNMTILSNLIFTNSTGSPKWKIYVNDSGSLITESI